VPRIEPVQIRPHEWVFGAFLAWMLVRLAWHAGPLSPLTLGAAGLLGLNVALIEMGRRSAQAGWDRARLLFYPAAINVVFPAMGPAVRACGTAPADEWLQVTDAALFGGNLSLRLEAATAPWLTEVLSGCYLLFFPYLLLSVLWYGLGSLPTARRCYAGLFVIYGVGFAGYAILPAAGPWIAMRDEFIVPLRGWWLTPLNDGIVRAGTNGVDVFPSLHAAVSAYLLWFDFRHKRWRFWSYLVPCVGLWVSTVYLRYHYAVDLLAGFTLAAVGAQVALRLRARQEA